MRVEMPRLKNFLHTHAAFIGVLALFASMLHFFPLKLLSPESYIYAAAIDGYYNLATTFQVFQNDVVLPDFGRYHPNHPLPHLIVGLLHDNYGFSSLALLRYMNAFGAFLTLFFVYSTLKRLFTKGHAAVLATAFIAFSFAFWQEALIGEVHLIAVGLLAAALYCWVLYSEQGSKYKRRYLFVAGLSFAVAVSFHLVVAFAALPILLAFFLINYIRKDWLNFFLVVLFITVVFSVVYVVVPIHLFDIRSVHEFISLVSIYTHLPVYYFSGAEWYRVLFSTFAHSFVNGYSSWGAALGFVCLGLLFWGYILFVKKKILLPIKIFVVGLPLIYFAINVLVNGRADGINGWLFCLPSFAIVIATLQERLNEIFELRFFILIFLAIVIIVNFSSGFFENSQIQDKEFIFSKDIPEFAREKQNTSLPPLMAYVANPSLGFVELSTIAEHQPQRSIDIILSWHKKEEGLKKLQSWMSSRKTFFILDDGFTDNIEKLLQSKGRSYTLLFDRKASVPETWVPSSIYFPRKLDKYAKRVRVWRVE
ncbi:MAG: hypothetical protein LDLANPLL_02863 [Turneriella sp.]|nr:hypothetical protein [Turneriella sp.]